MNPCNLETCGAIVSKPSSTIPNTGTKKLITKRNKQVKPKNK